MKSPIRFERLERTDHGIKSTYMWRLVLGTANVHLFFRGDGDEDPHDHPWSYWTFPFTDYIEEVYDPITAERTLHRLAKFHWHFRPAGHAHRVIGPWHEDGIASYVGLNEKWLTIVWKSEKTREWGFWTKDGWIGWRMYLCNNRN